MNPQEQNQANMVQALWVTTAINVIMAIGMIAYLVAEVLKVGAGAFKELKKD